MKSIVVKAILKGEENNPLFFHNALTDDMIIKYSVEQLLGDGIEVLDDSKIEKLI